MRQRKLETNIIKNMKFIIDHTNQINIGVNTRVGSRFVKNFVNYYVKGLDISQKDDDVENGWPVSGYKTIVLVRNPFNRLVSQFYDKCVDNPTHPTFTKFIHDLYRVICNNEPNPKIDKSLFLPQFSECYLNKMPFSKIYDIEDDFYSDFSRCFPKTGREIGPRTVLYQNDRKYVSVGVVWLLPTDVIRSYKSRDLNPHYREFYDDTLRKLVMRIYLQDFLILRSYGYSYFSGF